MSNKPANEIVDPLKSPKAIVKEELQLTGSLKDLLKIRRHMINLAIVVVVWIASSFNFYLISFQLKYIKGDVFVNTFVSAGSELPAIIIGGLMYQKVGLRFTLCLFFCIALSGSICLLILSDLREDLIPIFILLAKAGVSGTFNLCYLANAQIFPAIFAGTAFGFCNIGAKLATILAPLIAEVDAPTPMIIFTITAAVGGILSLMIRKEPK
jgi:hypothetical protein